MVQPFGNLLTTHMRWESDGERSSNASVAYVVGERK